MVDTPQLEYVHGEGQASISMFTNDLEVELEMEGKTVIHKDAKAGKVLDPNRSLRTFSFSCLLSAADMNTMMVTYLMPASAPDYSTAYPRFTKVYYAAASYWENVEVVCLRMRAKMQGTTEKWLCQFTFKEKTE